MLKLFLAAAIALAISPAAARDIQCQRWTDAKGRNLEKCDYVDQAPQAADIHMAWKWTTPCSATPKPI